MGIKYIEVICQVRGISRTCGLICERIKSWSRCEGHIMNCKGHMMEDMFTVCIKDMHEKLKLVILSGI